MNEDARASWGAFRFRLLAIVLLAFGIVVIGAVNADLKKTMHLKESGVWIQAEITDYRKSYSRRGQNGYNLFVTYDYGGRTYKDKFYKKINIWDSDVLREDVSILIDPDNPEEFVEKTSGMHFGMAVAVLFGMGSSFCATMVHLFTLELPVRLLYPNERWKQLPQKTELRVNAVCALALVAVQIAVMCVFMDQAVHWPVPLYAALLLGAASLVSLPIFMRSRV
ncbi:MAG: DUF3592 domain-containing protein [Clostridia bacterium]|nr:DUF3592 domain-containing protein [Clostridia bacterium]